MFRFTVKITIKSRIIRHCFCFFTCTPDNRIWSQVSTHTPGKYFATSLEQSHQQSLSLPLPTRVLIALISKLKCLNTFELIFMWHEGRVQLYFSACEPPAVPALSVHEILLSPLYDFSTTGKQNNWVWRCDLFPDFVGLYLYIITALNHLDSFISL